MAFVMRPLLSIIVSLLVAAPAFAADVKKDDDAPKKARAADSEDAKERSARRKAREEEMKSKAAEEAKEPKEPKTRRATKETATEEPKARRTAKEAAAEPADEPPKPKESRRSRTKAEAEPQPSKFEASVKRINEEIASRSVTRAALMPNAPPGAGSSARTHASAPARPKSVAPHAQPHAAHWSYSGESGPHRWGAMSPEWVRCASGSRQSPIDIRDGIKVDLDAIAFDYKPTRFTVIDNGHTIQVNLEGGNRITTIGRTYELVQFHFHMPAEERINGRGFEMVVHLVHKDAQERLAVVALLVERGAANAIVQSVWNNLPLEKHEPVPAQTTIDLAQLLPERREYFTYMGSLTTPPCSEGVTWIVMKQPLQLSPAQLAIFARLYPMNARPIQLQAGRVIKESN